MNVFGKSENAARNDVYIRLGLKKRTNAEVRDAFVKEIQEKCDAWGLTIPEYIEADQPLSYTV